MAFRSGFKNCFPSQRLEDGVATLSRRCVVPTAIVVAIHRPADRRTPNHLTILDRHPSDVRGESSDDDIVANKEETLDTPALAPAQRGL